MATIETLDRAKEQEEATTEGNEVTGVETWILNLDNGGQNVTQFAANKILIDLVDGNQYSFMEIGVTPHPDDSTVFSTGFSVNRNGDRTDQFTVTAQLTNNTDDIRSASGFTSASAKSVFDYQEVDVLTEVDISPITGKAITASNGESYFPKLLRKDTLTRIVITRNEQTFDPRKAAKFRSMLNETALNIDGRSYGPRLLLMESYTGKTAIDGRGREYYQVKYELLYNPESHIVTLIDVASGPDKNGTFPQIKAGVENKPYKLDGNGIYMVKALQEDPEEFETRSFFVHGEIAMGSLSL